MVVRIPLAHLRTHLQQPQPRDQRLLPTRRPIHLLLLLLLRPEYLHSGTHQLLPDMVEVQFASDGFVLVGRQHMFTVLLLPVVEYFFVGLVLA